jgi:hypothetical protein
MADEMFSLKPKELVKSNRAVFADTSDVQAVISLCEGYSFSCSGVFDWGGSCSNFWGVDKDNDVIF